MKYSLRSLIAVYMLMAFLAAFAFWFLLWAIATFLPLLSTDPFKALCGLGVPAGLACVVLWVVPRAIREAHAEVKKCPPSLCFPSWGRPPPLPNSHAPAPIPPSRDP
jgi:hypothetical protein